MRIYKMKSFKQFLNQDPDANDPFLEMPIRVKASFFNPDSRIQVISFQHAALDNDNDNKKRKSNETDQNKPEYTSRRPLNIHTNL